MAGMSYTTSHSVQLLKNCTVYTKSIEQLLEGEAFVSTVLSIFLLHFSNVEDVHTPVSIYDIITKGVLFAKACFVGVIVGIILSPMITKNDGHLIEVTPLLVGITLKYVKQSSGKKSEIFIDNFYAWQFYILEYTVFVVSGVISAFRGRHVIEDLLRGLLMYFYAILLRAIIWFSWYFLGDFIFGVNLSKKIAWIGTFAAYKTSTPLLLVYDNLIKIENTESKGGIGSIVSFFICFHCLFSSLFIPCLCKYFGLTDFSKKRLRRINYLLKRILNQRRKTIESQQKNIISANANLESIDYLTKIYKPKKRITTVDGYLKSKGVCTPRLASNISTDTEKSEESSEPIEENDDRPIQKQSSQDLVAKEHEINAYIKNSIRKRIYELQINSSGRQFSEEIISKKTHLFLTKKLDTPSLDKSWRRKKIHSTLSFAFLTKMQDFTNHFKSMSLRKPANFIRADFFNVISSPSYKLFLTTIIVIDSLLQFILVCIYYSQENYDYNGTLFTYATKEGPVLSSNINSSSTILQRKNITQKNIYANYLQATDHFCYGLFLGEFVFQILGWGFVQYFQQKTWFVEFSISIIVRSIEQVMFYLEINNEDVLQVDEIIMLLKSMFILRLVVVEQYFNKTIFSHIKHIVEYLKNRLLMNRLEREYGMAISHGDILQHYQNIFRSTETGRLLKKQWLNIRKTNKINMALLAEINNEVAVAMKSKKVAINVLKDSEYYIQELKQTGHVLEFETVILKKNLEEVKKRVKETIKVAPPRPKTLLQQVYWLRGDQSCSNYLLNHAEMVTFKAKERIIDFDEESSSLFIIVSGVCRYFYKPTVKSLNEWLLLGMLPNSDYFLHLRFKEVQQDIIEPGNLIGEFGLLTGRPYNVRIICENNVNSIKIPYQHLIKLFHKCHFGNIRLAKLWKTIGIRFCSKHFLPHFETLSRECLIPQLHKSLVPLLEHIKLVNLTDDISEVVLIEGTARDSLSRRHLTAPLHIKPQGQKLIVNYKNIPKDIPTRLMFIPKPGVNILDVVKSNDVFKNYIKYSRFVPKPFGEEMCLKARNKIKMIRLDHITKPKSEISMGCELHYKLKKLYYKLY
uniref:Cyclic nucleotide-binding domain-containing protein n=1 Tax=Rhodnius prolixus TaxID=13249 RepID=T1IDH1_RHOPR